MDSRVRGNDKKKEKKRKRKNMGKMPMLRMDETSKPRKNTAHSWFCCFLFFNKIRFRVLSRIS